MTLLNPRQVMFNSMYGAYADVELLGYGRKSGAGAKTLPYLQNLLLIQLCLMIVGTVHLALSSTVSFLAERPTIPALKGAANTTATAFCHHIGHILSMGSEKEVVGVDAFPVVAAVTDAHTLRNRADEVVVRKSMPCHELLVRPARDSVEVGVTTMVDASSPLPAAAVSYGIVSGEPFSSTLFHNIKSSVCDLHTVQKMGGIV